ncbi:hypothetical protein BABINDRAFT_166095 [Babjeviella inositovora NRRL Y-12698]|uniref:RNase III domain-containing protein n=1 Tax=Babjeviella inositovora NRRL Y-12698 TaxID=984486 RepID=A0A1E3QS12_9ASCO|nr:uncharacterized protein BABINDRAFT_166095 [Babjeviella inositovora NRRL Y-12698]ODQ80471.1 hypothetical protein BABINDRAFT_166095 [Babjeviella inositovora NRRL Y-12698]
MRLTPKQLIKALRPVLGTSRSYHLPFADISYEELKGRDTFTSEKTARASSDTSRARLSSILDKFPLIDRYPASHNPTQEIGDTDVVKDYHSGKKAAMIDTRLKESMRFFKAFVGREYLLGDDAIIRTIYPVSPIGINLSTNDTFSVEMPNRNMTILGQTIYDLAIVSKIVSIKSLNPALSHEINHMNFQNLLPGTTTESNILKNKSLLKAFLNYKGFPKHVRVNTPSKSGLEPISRQFEKNLAIKSLHHIIGEVNMKYGMGVAMEFVKNKVVEGDGLLRFVVDRNGGW